ncbi:MAG: GHMP kinase [Chloroflexota bacterium]
MTTPLRLITATAPVRVCDNGGWTDTWFAENGRIFNIAVTPGVQTQIAVYPRTPNRPHILLHAQTFGDRYPMSLDQVGWQHHPLLETAVLRLGMPKDIAVEITVHSNMPAGASTGTSAAVAVSLLGALDYLAGGNRTPHNIAYLAHAVETEMLGQQSGIQDQLAAAYGGINDIEMWHYPQAAVHQLAVSEPVLVELQQRLLLVFLGRPHRSTAVHEMVIRELEDAGPTNPKIEALRHCATAARDALLAGDFAAFGQAMRRNTAAQRHLNPQLISPEAQQIMDIAQAHGVLGGKVNGAGGNGGSVTLLGHTDPAANQRLLTALTQANPLLQPIPIQLSPQGLRVTG